MKISELIEQLGEVQGEHGDIEVRVGCYINEEMAEGELTSIVHYKAHDKGYYPEHVELSHNDGSV